MVFKNLILIVWFLLIQIHLGSKETFKEKHVYLMVLGTIQDAGSPQIGCFKECCKKLQSNPIHKRKVSSLGLIDQEFEKTFIIDATPDLVAQNSLLQTQAKLGSDRNPDAIFLTHAHMGHYTGLMYFGREAANSKSLPVYVMSRMQRFLENNGPWSQLIKLDNIQLKAMNQLEEIALTSHLKITPILVPHRDEFSETVGFLIEGPNKKALYIPDIDKWEKWENSLENLLNKVDYAFLDGTFFDGKELKNRNMSEVPHPCVAETIELLKNQSAILKNKVWFIHLNHTNPLLNNKSEAYKTLLSNGMHVALYGQIFEL